MAESNSARLLVLVADRAQAHVYATERLGAPMDRIVTMRNPNARRHERDLGTDAPGRSFNRASGVHQTFSPKQTLQQHDSEQFARVVGKTLELSLKSTRGNGIVLVAAPRMLTAIRRSLPKALQAKVLRAIAKDWTHQPKRLLVEHLADKRKVQAA